MIQPGSLKKPFLILSATVALLADPGPRIPVPKITMTEAIQAAQNQLDADLTKNLEFLRQMLLVEARYVSENYLVHEYPKLFPRSGPVIKMPKWFWVIGYVHPVSNDVSFTYCVDQSGQVRRLKATA
jgi:hypothetical protein